MTFCIITHVVHKQHKKQYYGYAPYVREMNIWLKYTDKFIVVAPLINQENEVIDLAYTHQDIQFRKVNDFNITSFKNILLTLLSLPKIAVQVFKAMKASDHIHLRCPGNMGLIGAIVQILFPKKVKTAKYAGNWDPKSKQPWSYRLQKWILSNTFLTKNIQVLVYGDWPNQSKNIKSFFTATYSESEIQNSEFRIQNKLSLQSESITTESDFDFAQSDKKDNNSLSLRAESRTNENQFKFLFIGTLSPGKQPLYAIQLVETLYRQGKKVTLALYGEGVLRKELELYIAQNKLEPIVTLKGNQSKETVLKAYQTSHFLILPSKSEGWPKVVAEAMFWGCVPIASPVSCVSYMMGNGSRGIILKEQLDFDVNQIINVLKNQEVYLKMSSEGQSWSRQFTTDKFEAEIWKLLK